MSKQEVQQALVPSATIAKSSKRLGLLAGVAILVMGVVAIEGSLLINQPEAISQQSPDSIVIVTDKNLDEDEGQINAIAAAPASQIAVAEKQRHQGEERNRSSLISKETRVNYTQLRNAVGNPRAVAQEFARVLRQAGLGRSSNRYLESRDIKKIPCEDFRIIDSLNPFDWVDWDKESDRKAFRRQIHSEFIGSKSWMLEDEWMEEMRSSGIDMTRENIEQVEELRKTYINYINSLVAAVNQRFYECVP